MSWVSRKGPGFEEDNVSRSRPRPRILLGLSHGSRGCLRLGVERVNEEGQLFKKIKKKKEEKKNQERKLKALNLFPGLSIIAKS